MTYGFLAIAFASSQAAPSDGLEALGYDRVRQITVAKPRTTFDNLNDLNGRPWVVIGRDQELHVDCVALTNDGFDLVTEANQFWSLRQGLSNTDGDVYFIVKKRTPFVWVSGTASQQQHMKSFQSVTEGADGILRFDNYLGVVDYKHRSRWVAISPYPLIVRNPSPKRETDSRYVSAGGADRLLVALIDPYQRGERPNTDVTVPLGGKHEVLRMAGRFDNLGRAVVELFVKTGPKTCEHRWYVVNFGTKRGSEDKPRRRTLPLGKYVRHGSSKEEFIMALEYERTLDRYLFRTADQPGLHELDASGRFVTSFLDKENVGDRLQYWRGQLLLEPVKVSEVPDTQGGTRRQHRSQGLYLFSADRKSKTFLGPYTWMCSSVNEKHLLLRRLTDETVWEFSWDKAPGK